MWPAFSPNIYDDLKIPAPGIVEEIEAKAKIGTESPVGSKVQSVNGIQYEAPGLSQYSRLITYWTF
ncbi:hypothetical protein JWG40_19525 [Leptospira sp. 201903074]|uniref:hypothetical protein n=1 Tax=Leptospira abararensis TaxID=2810036 RepID=UPI001964CCBA|nr:hypothetical protein [Leptospira abararensis]MBM9549222.1 hypothetical protein [Leptospira abararensis]